MTSLSTLVVTGYRQTIKVGQVVKLYKDIHNSAVPTHGRIQYLGPNTYSLTNYFKTIDCDNLESVQTFKVYSLQTNDSCESGQCIDSVRCISDMHGVSELASDTSLNGRYLARLKSSSGPGRDGASKKQLLEIWDRHKLLRSLDTSELDVHGPINTDVHFSRLVWSPFGEQDKLLYVCQRKRPKSMPFLKESASEKKTSSNETDPPTGFNDPTCADRGEEFLRKEDWGECLVDIEHTIVAVLDVANDCRITTIDVDGYSLGCPQWIDNGSKIISVAYTEAPRRLGIIYCNNRASKIMVHDWKSSDVILKLESDTECFHTPRVNNAGNKFIYCKNNVYGSHFHAMKFHIYDIVTRQDTALVDKTTKRVNMFFENIPHSCFTSDDKHILFVETDHLYHHMCLFSLETSKISKIKFPTTGLSIMDFRHDIILASGNEANTTPTLFVAKLCLSSISDVVAWHQIEDCTHLDEIDYEAFEVPTQDKSSFLSAILIKPDANAVRQNLRIDNDDGSNLSNKLPTVVRVHGGPASAYNVCYYPDNVLLTRLGLQTLFINYRGSKGVSQEYTESLNGLVGEQDVEDCLHVIRHFVKEKLIDPKKLIIEGGSHGGFLSCHLSCQDEFKFTSAIIRNPVIDISSIHSSSDIPDWAYTVSLGQKGCYDASWVPDSHDLKKMLECSPISKSNKANVPTAMFLGSQDRRVPMSQGERWVDVLRARGVEVLCKVYPDRHSFSKPENYSDYVITSVIWMLNHLPKY